MVITPVCGTGNSGSIPGSRPDRKSARQSLALFLSPSASLPDASAIYNDLYMEPGNKSTVDFFSLIIPAMQDRDRFDIHVGNVCTVLDKKIPGCYEIVAVESRGSDDSLNDWDHVKGEILVIIDGDLENQPTSLGDVVTAFEEGNDMAFAGQYPDSNNRASEANLCYFGIRRNALSRLHESPEGHKLILEILGPETIKKLGASPSEVSGSYILKHLKRMIGVMQ